MTELPSAVTNPLLELREQGQSVWLDYIRRSLITSGELERRIALDGLAGVTSNPAIFERAMSGGEYSAAIDALSAGAQLRPQRLFELLAIEDIRAAADVLLRVYESSGGVDGYVSLEVAPDLAHDTEGTLQEARRLWKEVHRKNLMIKVPATTEGLTAVRLLLSEGVNVNITLLFDRGVYQAVAEAFLEALETRLSRGLSLDALASVASFFVSRIDVAVDALLEQKLAEAAPEQRRKLSGLLGKVAIANAKLAYQSYRRIFSGPRWQALEARGAHPQRVLWASTGAKNPAYRDVLYVEELVGPETVNTMPPETLAAFRDHGRVRPSLEEGVAEAASTLRNLEEVGISLAGVSERLTAEGVRKFAEPFAQLLQALERRAPLLESRASAERRAPP